VDVVTLHDLFAGLILGRNVVGGECVGAIFASPGNGALKSLERVRDLPFGGTEISQEALVSQKHAFVVSDGLIFGILGCTVWESGPL